MVAAAGDRRDPRRRRESFDTVADRYVRYRRGYPLEVVADLAGACSIGPGVRVLEIGCGTGQLSVPLARLGASLTAVELGPALAATARSELEPYPQARVEVAAFETWPPPADPFDVVVCANAFHWLDPAVRFVKCAAALRPGGTLAILQPHYVAGGTDSFVNGSQQWYLRYGLSDEPTFSLPPADEVPPAYPELDEDSSFVSVSRRRHERDRRYSAGDYAGLLSTDSLVLGLDEQARSGFLAGIEELIETRYAGEIVRRFLYEIVIARTPSS